MNEIKYLKVWVQSILPVVYDDSLSYYEVLAKVVSKTNEIINGMTAIGKNTEAINSLVRYYNELARELDSIKDTGISVSNVVTNLLQNWNNGYAYSQNGITFDTDANTGEIKVWGSFPSGGAVTTPWTVGVCKLAAGTYRLQGCPADGGVKHYRLQVNKMVIQASGQYEDGGEIVAVDTGSGATFVTSNEGYYKCYLICGADMPSISEFSAVTFKPMIKKGDEEVAFIPYSLTLDEVSRKMYDGGTHMKNQTPGIVDQMARTAMSFIKYNTTDVQNASPYIAPRANTNLYYDSDTQNAIHMFNPDLMPTENDLGKHPMTCTTLVGAMLFNIPYENSCYEHEGVQIVGRYACDDEELYDNLLSNDFFAAKLYNYLYQKGYCFDPTDNLSNVQPGDIMFFCERSFPVRNYGNVTHCAILGYWVNDHIAGVFEANLLPMIHGQTVENLKSRGLYKIARPPISKNCLYLPENLVSSTDVIAEKLGVNIHCTKTLKAGHLYTAVVKATQSEGTDVYFGMTTYATYAQQISISMRYANHKPSDDVYIMPFVPNADADQFSCYRFHPETPVASIVAPEYEFVGVYEGLITGISI